MSDYHITYTIGKRNAVSDTTNDTHYIIREVNSSEPIELILIAENVLCTTVLYNSNISELSFIHHHKIVVLHAI